LIYVYIYDVHKAKHKGLSETFMTFAITAKDQWMPITLPEI